MRNISSLIKHRYIPVRNIILIGAGGTGGYILPSLIRMVQNLNLPPDRSISITVFDDDIVEEHNCNRQNFSTLDVGKSKSKVLAERYTAEFAYPVNYVADKFKIEDFTKMVDSEMQQHGNGVIIIDAIDKLKLRLDLHKSIAQGWKRQIIWMSVGNTEDYGQLVITFCNDYPRRTVVDLFKESFTEEELKREEEEEHVSCDVIVVSKPQTLSINLTAANVVTNALYSILYEESISYDVVLFNSKNECKTIGYLEPLLNVQENKSELLELFNNQAKENELH